MPTYLDRTLLTCLDPLSCRLVSLLSGADWSLASPFANPSSSFFVQLSHRRSLPTSGHAEISSPKPFVWFRAKTDKGTVCLADHLLSVTDTEMKLLDIEMKLFCNDWKWLYRKMYFLLLNWLLGFYALFRIIGVSPSDVYVSYPWYSFGWGSYPSAKMQSVYSRAPAD